MLPSDLLRPSLLLLLGLLECFIEFLRVEVLCDHEDEEEYGNPPFLGNSHTIYVFKEQAHETLWLLCVGDDGLFWFWLSEIS